MVTVTADAVAQDLSYARGETSAREPTMAESGSFEVKGKDIPLETLALRLADRLSPGKHTYRTFNGAITVSPKSKRKNAWERFRDYLTGGGEDYSGPRWAVRIEYNGNGSAHVDYNPEVLSTLRPVPLQDLEEELSAPATIDDFVDGWEGARNEFYKLVKVMRGRNSSWHYLRDRLADHLGLENLDWTEFEDYLKSNNGRTKDNIDEEIGLDEVDSNNLYDVGLIADYIFNGGPLKYREKEVDGITISIPSRIDDAAEWLREGATVSELPYMFRQDEDVLRSYVARRVKPELKKAA